MILVYTGNGKGKTSACVGQAMRALGHGFAVAFGQFIKRDGQAGEQAMLTRLLGSAFRAGGAGFFHQESERPLHRQKSLALLQWAASQHARMLILDEAIYALNYGLILQEELKPFLGRSDSAHHLVLSGRGAPQWLIEAADLVTEMREVRHPLRNGAQAAKGIEF